LTKKFKIDTSMNDLYDILGYRRGHDTQGELDFIMKYIVVIPGINRDEFGNYYLRIGDAPILWSCHVDTVHSEQSFTRQKLSITEDNMLWTDDGSCLGADNGVGCWLLLRMIKAGIEGLYVFHRQEEIGRQGSMFIVKKNPDILKGINFAIAFDRRNTKSIITHQITRTCSDKFAESLAKVLGMDHIKDDTGSYTDTKSYVDHIPECTNVSAGFFNEHQPTEAVDLTYCKNLLEHVLKADFTKLVIDRDITDPVEFPVWTNWGKGGYSSYGYGSGKAVYGYYPEQSEDMAHLIRANPRLVRDILEESGVTYSGLMMDLMDRGGFIPGVYDQYAEFEEIEDMD
jgi:hypothetical protein